MLQRFGKSDAPALQEPVARVLNSKGFTGLIRAKLVLDPVAQHAAWREAQTLFARALPGCADADRAMVLGNLGYASMLVGDWDRGRESMAQALRHGGEALYQGTLDDLNLNSVAADEHIRAVVNELWAK